MNNYDTQEFFRVIRKIAEGAPTTPIELDIIKTYWRDIEEKVLEHHKISDLEKELERYQSNVNIYTSRVRDYIIELEEVVEDLQEETDATGV